jgi:hypothetical protein
VHAVPAPSPHPPPPPPLHFPSRHIFSFSVQSVTFRTDILTVIAGKAKKNKTGTQMKMRASIKLACIFTIVYLVSIELSLEFR